MVLTEFSSKICYETILDLRQFQEKEIVNYHVDIDDLAGCWRGWILPGIIQRAGTVEWDHQIFSEDNCRLPPIRILQWTHNAHARHTCHASDLLQGTTTISFKKWWRMNAFIISFRCWSPIKCEGGCEAWLEIMLVSTPLPLPSIPIQTLTPFRPEKYLTTFFSFPHYLFLPGYSLKDFLTFVSANIC